jgi:hypothetical protein
VSRYNVAIIQQFHAVHGHFFSLGRKSGDKVGADRRVLARSLDPLDRADRVGAAVPSLHALEDQVVAGLQRQMEMRHQPRLAGDQLEQRLVDLDAVERGQAQPLEPRLGGEQALAQSPEPTPIVGDVDAGQDDFFRVPVDLAADCIADGVERQ